MRGIGHMDYLIAKREPIMASLSPAARHHAFPRLYAMPVPIADPAKELRLENTALKATVRQLQSELHGLRLQLEDKTAASKNGPAAVQAAFLKALDAAGYRIKGLPVILADLKSARGSIPMIAPRHVCIWLACRICRICSLTEIGRHFGGRDPSSISHAVERAPVWMVAFPVLRGVANALLETFAEYPAQSPAEPVGAVGPRAGR